MQASISGGILKILAPLILIGLAVAFFYKSPPIHVINGSSLGAGLTPQDTQQVLPLLGGPTYEVLHGAEVVWQSPGRAARGVLFLAHGCSHSATDFWPKSESCVKCIGLPVEVNITRHALARGYFVVAVSSAERSHKCWGLPGMMDRGPSDAEQVRKVLETLIPREGLALLPVYALGASSGGAFVLMLGTEVRLKAICSQIMALPDDMLADAVGQAQSKGFAYPPTLFIHMVRDKRTAEGVAMDLGVLNQLGVNASEIGVKPTALKPTSLNEAIGPEISPELSVAIFEAFRSAGLIDAEGLLTDDPRRSGWREVVLPLPGAEGMRLKPDLSPVAEVLNLHYAQHEIISTTTTDMLDWFEGLG